jgi:nicotinate dehydrogenase subunit B
MTSPLGSAGRRPAISATANPTPRPIATRRTFLRRFSGGLAVLWFVETSRPPPPSPRPPLLAAPGPPPPPPRELAAWLHIAADGAITVFTGKVEIGQNARTSLTQIVAEELPAPLTSITLVMGDTSLTPFDRGTSGSRTTPDMVPILHRAAATARESLLDLAAKKLSVDRATLTARDGRIHHSGTPRSLGYGELTRGEKLVLDIADTTPIKPATAWTVAGTSVPKIGARAFVTGRHIYTTDFTRPGLLHGRVLRPASFGASLATLDTSAADALSGATIVRDGEFVGAFAATEHLAAQAIAALRATWKTTPQLAERDLFTHLRATARTRPPAATATDPALTHLAHTYTVPYLAHAPLEPHAAVAEWTAPDRLTAWVSTQHPFAVRNELARVLALPPAHVRVLVPDVGSGFGGKHTAETALEAARLARVAQKPVKVVCTREEEFTWFYSRPAGVIDISSAARADGTVVNWTHDNINSGASAIRAPYEFAAQRTAFHAATSPLRQGPYRGLAATANAFARETHLDELARALRLDPLALRRQNLREPRALAALDTAARAFGWNFAAPRRPDTGIGLSFHSDKGAFMGTFAEVSVAPSTGRITVTRVVQSFDPGAIINPAHLRSQVEGCIIQGLGAALFEAVHFDHGRIQNPTFSTYRVPRFSDTPRSLEVILIDHKELPPSGAGESPLGGIAPAIGNAIFDATARRLRSLPFT